MADIKYVSELVERLQTTIKHDSDELQDQTARREALQLARLVVSSLEDPTEKAFNTFFLVRTYRQSNRISWILSADCDKARVHAMLQSGNSTRNLPCIGKCGWFGQIVGVGEEDCR